MTRRQIERFRSDLIERLTALYRGVHSEIRDSMIRQVVDDDQPGDEADESQRVQLRDLRLRLAENDAARAQEMEAALRRIREGFYGECIECGSPIGIDRLRLVPWALRCFDCQQSAESELRQRSPTM